MQILLSLKFTELEEIRADALTFGEGLRGVNAAKETLAIEWKDGFSRWLATWIIFRKVDSAHQGCEWSVEDERAGGMSRNDERSIQV